jgi:dTDP-N-acetylfucosamine:lipid II N-acetylfucosaminyltransferase
MVTLHIFFDKGGFFSSKTIEFVEKIEPKTHFYYFENTSKIDINNVKILTTKNEVFKLVNNGTIYKIVFHSLHYFQFSFLEKIKKNSRLDIKIAWVFWSFEYYQLPFNLSNLYSKFCLRFKYRKITSLLFENTLYFIKGQVKTPFLINSNKYFSTIKKVDQFYSFIEDDYFEIYKNTTTTEYNFLSYLDLNDLTNSISKNHIEETIMVGHSGYPQLNHYEVLNSIKKFNLLMKVIIPVSNGNKKYIKKLKQKIKQNFNFHIDYLDRRLPLDEYYSALSSVSIFFLNSYCQQGLGNIVFFLLNETTLYLSEKSSTYKFLKRNGFALFSIESLKNSEKITVLNENEKSINKLKIKEILNPSIVENQWRKLLSN